MVPDRLLDGLVVLGKLRNLGLTRQVRKLLPERTKSVWTAAQLIVVPQSGFIREASKVFNSKGF
ncbi:MAG: hypothetical protein EBS75_06985 [Betaproteobacteria bacterium]|nr:hypothetical protein [Betaproteobacteria bacterium]